MFVLIPLFPKPVVRNELLAVLPVAPEPRVKRFKETLVAKEEFVNVDPIVAGPSLMPVKSHDCKAVVEPALGALPMINPEEMFRPLVAKTLPFVTVIAPLPSALSLAARSVPAPTVIAPE